MCYVFGFSWNIFVIIVQSRLKLYDFTILAAGVEPIEQVCNPFAQRRHHVSSTCACLIELKTEFELEQAISLQTTVVSNVRIHHLALNARHKEQLFSV